jgi:hypothetical protein
MLTKVADLLRDNKPDEALETIHKTYDRFLHIDVEDLDTILENDPVNKLINEHNFDEHRLNALADLLKAEGDIYLHEAKEEKAKSRYYKALILFEYLNQTQQVYSFDREAKISDMKEKIRKIEEQMD